MKAYSTVVMLVFVAVFGVIISGCSDSTTPSDPSIPLSEFPTSFNGGDLRGTWLSNTPHLRMSAPGGTVNFSRNIGEGSLVFSGSSATSGTFAYSNYVQKYTATVRLNGSSDSETIKSDDETPSSTTGEWRVVNGILRMYFGSEYIPYRYSVTSRGLFLELTFLDDNGRIVLVQTQAFRK